MIVIAHRGHSAGNPENSEAALRRSDGSPAALKLGRVLDLAKGRVMVLLDVKEGTAAMLDAVLPMLARRGMAEQVVYGARFAEHLAALRRRAPAMETLGLVRPEEIGAELDAGAATTRLWERHLDDDRAAAIRDAGGRLCVMFGGEGTGRAAGDIDRATLAALVDRWHPDAVMVYDLGLPEGR